jgi:hypothetical protein
LIVLFAAGYAAVYGRGKQRAFCSGFALVMVLTGVNFFGGALSKYIPNFYWRTMQAPPITIRYSTPPVYTAPVWPSPTPADSAPQPYTPTPVPPTPVTVAPVYLPATTVTSPQFTLALNATIELVWTFALASIVGLIGVWTYSVTRRDGRTC